MSLSYFNFHPLRVPRYRGGATIGDVLAAEKAVADLPRVHPHVGAFIHYGGVELVDRLRLSSPVLPAGAEAELAHLWNRSCGVVCRRLLFYTWRIIAKEQRHGKKGMAEKAFGPDKTKWTPGQAVVAAINKSGDYENTLEDGAEVPVSDYLSAVILHYEAGGWAGAFGGKKWGFIARQVADYFDGKLSAMLAADRMWTLVHNTGPIFNKGFYFHNHNTGMLSKVLDAQAKGSVFGLNTKAVLKDYNPEIVAPFMQFADGVRGILGWDHSALAGDATGNANGPDGFMEAHTTSGGWSPTHHLASVPLHLFTRSQG